MIAYDVRHYNSIGSTNDEAQRLARDGAVHGTVVCAREQTAGRGRHARQWHSPAGNLYVSILLRLDMQPSRIAQLSFVAALAVGDTLDQFLPDGVGTELKWPNDVLVHRAKIAGILIENMATATIVGTGLNLRHAPTDAPYPVTSLAAIGRDSPDARLVLQVLLDAFARRYGDWMGHGFAATRTAWLTRAHPTGSPLRVTIGDRSIEGCFVDLGHDGALIIETADGPKHFVAGEVGLV